MFDVGFSEMLLIGIVALVVIGPERLPRVARTLGVLFGRLQRYVTQVKADINREMEMADLGKVKSEFEDAARSFKSDIEAQAAKVESEIREARTSIDRELEDVAKAAGEVPAHADAPAAEAAAQLELDIGEPAPPPAAAPPAAPPPAPARPS